MNNQVECNNDIHEMLNDNFGFPIADASYEDPFPLGRESVTQAKTISL